MFCIHTCEFDRKLWPENIDFQLCAKGHIEATDHINTVMILKVADTLTTGRNSEIA